MCAIAGMVGIYSDQTIEENMLYTMRRRGPDGKGIFHDRNCVLLHSRLAIIDPMGGQQPMSCTWNDETFTIVYNGELYNTEEVRMMLLKFGHCFTGHCDTEVVLHAFAQWGEESLQLLNGIFSFAVWTQKKRKLFLARDRMGVKPLFFKEHQGGFIFASELKTILAYPTIVPEIDKLGACQLLMLGPGRVPGSGVFKGLSELKPGHCGWFYNGRLTVKEYWRLRDREHTESFEETVSHVKYLVTDAIRRQMISDVPIGCFLSGGLDSSLISAVCAQFVKESGTHLTTFSLDYKDNSKFFKAGKFQPEADTKYIDMMAAYLDTESRRTILTPDDVFKSLEDAVIARDLPGMADVDSSLLSFCKEIRNDVKVALSGECADEIFGGYPWYRDRQIREADGFPWSQNVMQRREVLAPWIREQVDPLDFVQNCYAETIKNADISYENSPDEARMKQMVNLNYQWFMQTLLDRKDRMSMYCGLEVRVPFCDYRIAEYLYAVPWEFKDYKGYEKGLLRKAMAEWLPKEILWRKKSPYPKTHDPYYAQLVCEKLREILNKKDAPIFQIVDRNALVNLMESDPKWPWYGQLMQVPQTTAYMIQLNFWLSHYGVSVH